MGTTTFTIDSGPTTSGFTNCDSGSTAIARSIRLKFTPGTTAAYNLDTCTGTTIDTVLAVLSACTDGTASLACNDQVDR